MLGIIIPKHLTFCVKMYCITFTTYINYGLSRMFNVRIVASVSILAW